MRYVFNKSTKWTLSRTEDGTTSNIVKSLKESDATRTFCSSILDVAVTTNKPIDAQSIASVSIKTSVTNYDFTYTYRKENGSVSTKIVRNIALNITTIASLF